MTALIRRCDRRVWRHVSGLVLFWLPFVIWMAIVFWLSHQPSLPHPAREHGVSDYVFDYAAHALTFALLTVLGFRAAAFRPTWLPLWLAEPSTRTAGVFSAMYGLSDELHQGFVPGRHAKLSDWLADLFGVGLGILAIAVWRRLRARWAR